MCVGGFAPKHIILPSTSPKIVVIDGGNGKKVGGDDNRCKSDKASAEEVLRYCLDGGQPGTSRRLHNALSTHSPHDAVLC
jgi:hypothetical protein